MSQQRKLAERLARSLGVDISADVGWIDDKGVVVEVNWALVYHMTLIKEWRGSGPISKYFGADLLTQPAFTTTIGVPVDPNKSGYLGANLLVTLANFHLFRDRGRKELLELAVGQVGISGEIAGESVKSSLQAGISLEVHVSRKVSLVAAFAASFDIKSDRVEAHPSLSTNLNLVWHLP